jgi:hypothetical protein
MSFLNPFFLLGSLAALVPVLLHLVRRERALKFEFPTLMFLRRVTRRSIRYQKLRHLMLLALRVLALLFLTLAFTRPFSESPRAAGAAGRVTEAHVLLLDNSMSMGYGDRWARARQAAAGIVRAARSGDKVALLEFSDQTVVQVPLSADLALVLRAIEGATSLTDRSTRYGQALRAAEQSTMEAGTTRRIIHLISDFQKNGWSAAEQDVRLGAGLQLETVDVGDSQYSNLAPEDVQLIGTGGGEKDSLKLRFSVANFGTEDRNGVRVELLVDGPALTQKSLDLPHGAVAPVEFSLPPLAAGEHTVVIRVQDNRLERDNRFSLTVQVRRGLPVLVIEEAGAGRKGRPPSFFLAHALNVSGLSPYQLTTAGLREAEARRSFESELVVWNNVAGGSSALQGRLRSFVSAGNGLVVVVSTDSAAADFDRGFAGWIPVTAERTGRRLQARESSGNYSLLTDLRLNHAIFRPFGEPHSGSFSSARFYSHSLLKAGAGAQVIARFDNGDPAVIVADIGEGRVVVMSFSVDDSSNDLPLKAVYAPFWQQVMNYLRRYQSQRHWVEVGQSIEPRRLVSEVASSMQEPAPEEGASLALLDPDGKRLPSPGPDAAVTVDRAGFYEVRCAGLSARVAVNTVPDESDLTPGNPEEMAAEWMSTAGPASSQTMPEESVSLEEQEKRESLWRWLLLAALALLLAEGWLGNRTVLKAD